MSRKIELEFFKVDEKLPQGEFNSSFVEVIFFDSTGCCTTGIFDKNCKAFKVFDGHGGGYSLNYYDITEWAYVPEAIEGEVE